MGKKKIVGVEFKLGKLEWAEQLMLLGMSLKELEEAGTQGGKTLDWKEVWKQCYEKDMHMSDLRFQEN